MKQKETNFHLIGIGGVGMSALARILLEKQFSVTGSDLNATSNTQDLIKKGAQIHFAHSEKNVPTNTTIVYSSDIKQTNPELHAAKVLNYPILHRSELLALLMKDYTTLAVAGTHGKTTTASLLSHVLCHAGWDPTFAIGGMLNGINGRLGKSEYFVAEADESDGSFLNYHPYGAIITNMEPEHMDYYKNQESLCAAFQQFFNQITCESCLFYYGDDPRLHTLNKRGFSYGFGKNCHLAILNRKQEGWNSEIDIAFEGIVYRNIRIPLIGKHNALNGAAVFGLCLKIGLPEQSIRDGIFTFPGLSRRCQNYGEYNGVLLLDDYAHHPTEIQTTLFGVREAIKERRLIVVFQPHRYTRVKSFLDAFATSFDFADELFVTDIYSAREESIPGVSVETILNELKKNSTVPSRYVPKEHLGRILTQTLLPHDVLLTLGAGDLYKIHENLRQKFEQQLPRKLVVGLIFGGKSCEHEISLRSARFIHASLKSELYDIKYFAIDKSGNWLTGEYAKACLEPDHTVVKGNSVPLLSEKIVPELSLCDIFFPVLHGPFGEDGTLQGFLEMLEKPYAGPGFRGAAICMDKILTKKLVAFEGVPTPHFYAFGYWEWLHQKDKILSDVKQSLKLPVFVKPSHAGSSIGITKISEYVFLERAIEYAFRFDYQLLIEEGKEGCRELEFAVLGNSKGEIHVPPPGEKLSGGNFVDYEKKYGSNSVKTTLDAQLEKDLLEKGKTLALKAYEATGNSGMTRVDFLLDKEGNFWFFEMNPIPGLTPLSLYPKIWERQGMDGQKLVDRLIILGLQRNREQKRHLNPL